MTSPSIWQLLDLKDRVFLVVGGAQNLGRDMALALAEAHADGLLTSREEAKAVATAGEIAKATDRNVRGQALDALDENVIQQTIEQVVAEFGQLDIVINNVGGAVRTGEQALDIENRQRADWDKLLSLNVTAPFLVCKHAARVMKKQGRGSIINIASIAGVVGRDRRMYSETNQPPQETDYAAAKAAVIGFTRDLAAVLGPHGVRVNAISPGGFERGQPQNFVEAYSRRTMLGRMGRDGIDLKGAAVFLASDAAAYVTGHNLVVDGGFSEWQ